MLTSLVISVLAQVPQIEDAILAQNCMRRAQTSSFAFAEGLRVAASGQHEAKPMPVMPVMPVMPAAMPLRGTQSCWNRRSHIAKIIAMRTEAYLLDFCGHARLLGKFSGALLGSLKSVLETPETSFLLT